jgi:hypothetical protein
MVDSTTGRCKRESTPAPPCRNDLCGDGHCCFLWGAPAEVEPYWTAKARQGVLANAALKQLLVPLIMGAPRPHGAQVRDLEFESCLNQRNVELRIMSQNTNRGASIDAAGR